MVITRSHFYSGEKVRELKLAKNTSYQVQSGRYRPYLKRPVGASTAVECSIGAYSF